MVVLPAFSKPLLLKDPGKLTPKLLTSSAGDGGDYGKLVAFRDLRVLAFEVTDVLVALVDVDEGSERAVASIEVLLEVGVFGGEVPKGFSGRRTTHLDFGVAGGVLSQGCWDLDLRHI